MKKRLFALLLALVMLVAVAACAQQEQKEPEATTQKVTGMGGVEVELPAKINTIVDTWSAATDNLFNLGAGDLLVSAHSAAVSDMSVKLCPEMATMEDYSKATAEELLKINPDLVIVSNEEKETELRNAGLNAINLVYMNYEDFKKSTLILGQILGDEYEKRAEGVAEYVDWVTSTLETALKDVKEEDKPVVYYVMGKKDKNLYSTCGGGSIMDEWITKAGGKLATADLGKGMGLKDVTAEQILATNPDVIMIDGDNAAEMRDAFLSSSEWAGITAVKNNAIYCIPKGCFWWGRLNGDIPLQALWAASILHPDEVKDAYDIKEETKKFYKEFKQYELTDEEVNTILRTDLLPQ